MLWESTLGPSAIRAPLPPTATQYRIMAQERLFGIYRMESKHPLTAIRFLSLINMVIVLSAVKQPFLRAEVEPGII
jgi:hypothetical protein